MPDPSQLTERQTRWFESVRLGLEQETGRSLQQWVEIARACPEQGARARLAWMKLHHGLGQNRASIVLNAAFPAAASWATPDLLADALWQDASAAQIIAAIRAMCLALPDVVVGQRKGFTAFSRKVQFAAARPAKRGGLVLGLALDPECDARLQARGRESWSERLKSSMAIETPEQIDASVHDLLRQAWDHCKRCSQATAGQCLSSPTLSAG